MFGIQKRFMLGGAVVAVLVVSGRAAREIPQSHSVVSSEAGAGTKGEIRHLEENKIEILGENYWYQFKSLKYDAPYCLQRKRTYLKLAKCDGDDNRMKWHINESGTVKNKDQYFEQSFCLHVQSNGTVRVRRCLEGSVRQTIGSLGRQTFMKIRHGDAAVRFEAVASGGGCVVVSGKGYGNYYDEDCDDGNSHVFDVLI